LEAAVKEIGKGVTGVQGDVSKRVDLIACRRKSSRRRGGWTCSCERWRPKYGRLGEISEELFDSIFDINVKGVLFTVQKALLSCRMALPSSSMPRTSQ